MAEKKSQAKYVNKYMNKMYDRINFTVPKGKKEIIQKYADSRGESVNGMLWRLVAAEVPGIAGDPEPEAPADAAAP